MSRPHPLALPLAAIAALAALAGPARALADHEDERLGFKIAVPKEWTAVPMGVEDRWMVAKYLSPKAYFWTEPGGGWTYEHKPDMQVIAFVADAVKEKLKLKKDKDRSGRERIIVLLDSPYKDYEDFMKRRYTGGGWYVESKEEGTVGDVPVTQIEIRVDKLSQDGPKRILTWVYHVPDVDLAVQFEVLQDAYPKLKNELRRCFKSFKSIERSGEALYDQSTGDKRLTFLELDELTPEERAKHRQGYEREAHEKAEKTVPDGWTVKRMGRFLVINHSDDKFAKTIVERAEAVWDWLDDTFPFIGPKEYVRAPIIRICKDQDEYWAFFKSSEWSWTQPEITTYQDHGGTTSYALQNVNRAVLNTWFQDKDRDLYFALPGWLGTGLAKIVENLRVKNGKVEIGVDLWDRDETREIMREGRNTPIRDLLVMSGQSFWEDFQHYYEASSLVTFFVNGSASRNKRTKDLLPQYLENLKAVTTEIEKEREAKSDEKAGTPQSEEEEDKWFRERRQALKNQDKRLLEDTFSRTFLGWSEKDWDAFQDAYEKSIGFRKK